MNVEIGTAELIVFGFVAVVVFGFLAIVARASWKIVFGSQQSMEAGGGRPSHPQLRDCPGCGARISVQNSFCPDCGLRVST